MVNISTLYINHDKQELHIVAAIDDKPYYNNVYITGVKIDTQDTFTNGFPSQAVVFSRDVDSTKQLEMVIPMVELGVGNLENLFFVYVITNDGYGPDTPCGLDTVFTLGVTTDYVPFMSRTLDFARGVGDECNLPMSFIANILQYYALKLAIETCNYNEAIFYFNTYFKKIKNVSHVGGCGCHG